MKRQNILAACLAASAVVLAADIVWINNNTGLTVGFTPDPKTTISYSDDRSEIVIASVDGTIGTVSTANGIDISADAQADGLTVVFDGASATLLYPDYFDTAASDDISVTTDGAHIAITVGSATQLSKLAIAATGSTSDGQLKIYSDIAVTLTLDGVDITNQSGSAVNIQGAKTEIVLSGDNKLCDSETYSTPSGEKEKSTLYGTKALTFSGDGSLSVAAKYKHAICTEKSITINGGNIYVTESANDGIHSSGVTMKGGYYYSNNTVGDAIDADDDEISVKGGTIEIVVPTADTKGLKADGNITISDGTVNMTLSGDQVKGIKSKSDFIMKGGSIISKSTGNCVVTDGDPSYCTSIKSDANITISGGSISITATGLGNKGISCDSIATFTGGTFDIAMSGDGAVYVDANGNYDTYSSTCITTDGEAYIYGGTYNLNNSGSAGKCIKCDVDLVFGTAEAGPTITATTTGQQIQESQASSSSNPGGGPGNNWGGGWGPGGGGFDSGADYSNPKVIKATGNLTIDNGTFVLTSTSEGGEGLESKKTLTINDGYVEISTVDDCINANSHIQINGGLIHCSASNNDGIDSNGTLTVTGGIVIAIGTTSPEEGFDCDDNTFSITGGTLIGLGGSSSTPTESKCTQCVVLYGTSFTNGTTYTVVDPSGNHVLSFKCPKSISSGKMLISAPGIVRNAGTYTIYTGGTVTGGETYWELTKDATYTNGTPKKTFSLTTKYYTSF